MARSQGFFDGALGEIELAELFDERQFDDPHFVADGASALFGELGGEQLTARFKIRRTTFSP